MSHKTLMNEMTTQDSATSDNRESYQAPTIERLGNVTELTGSTAQNSGSDSYAS